MVAEGEAVAVAKGKSSVKCVLSQDIQLLYVIIGSMHNMCLNLLLNLLGRVNRIHGGLLSHLGSNLQHHGSHLHHLGSKLQHILHGNLLLLLSSGLISQVLIPGHLLNGPLLSRPGLPINGILNILQQGLILDNLI